MSFYQKKKCMKCGKPASHKFTRIQDGQIYDLYLCGDHAAEMSPYQKPKQVPLSEILEGLLKQDFNLKVGGGSQAPGGVRCRHCGLPFESYRKNLLLGCSECYDSFHDYLLADLRRFHGEVRHVGRRPGGGAIKPSTEPAEPLPQASEPEPPAAPLAHSATKGAEKLIKTPESAIEELTRAMKAAIADEDYERAARCRDQIAQLRRELNPESGDKPDNP